MQARPHRTNPLLAGLGGLLMVISLLVNLAGAISVPVLAMVTENHPETLSSEGFRNAAYLLPLLGWGLSGGIMLLAAILLILARRWMGGAHMVRAVLGSGGLLVSLFALFVTLGFDRVDWLDKASLVRHGYARDVVRDILQRMEPAGLLATVLLLLASVLVLAWPPRRHEQTPAVGKGV